MMRSLQKRRWILLLLMGIYLPSNAGAAGIKVPQQTLRDLYERQYEIHQRGLYIVGAWSLLNLGVSAIQKGRTTGETACIYRASFAWSLFNLGIVGIGLWANAKRPDTLTLGEVSREIAFSKYFFVATMTFDIASVAVGCSLVARGNGETVAEKRNKWRGYGKGIIIQGAALFVMDLISFIAQNSNFNKYHKILEAVQLTPTGADIVIQF